MLPRLEAESVQKWSSRHPHVFNLPQQQQQQQCETRESNKRAPAITMAPTTTTVVN